MTLTRAEGLRGWLMLVACAFLLLLAGCGRQALYSELSEPEANELIAALQSAEITAGKVDQGKAKFTVEVDEGDFARAVSVLRAQGLPKPKYDNLGTVFKKSGFGDNSTEAHARFVHAKQQEMMNAIRKIDGVVDTSVELSIPQQDRLVDQPPLPSASVLVKYRPGSNLQARASDIKGLIANGVESLTYDRVNVVMFRADEPAPPARTSIDIPWATGLVVVLALLIGGTGLYGLRQRRRQQAAARAIARQP